MEQSKPCLPGAPWSPVNKKRAKGRWTLDEAEALALAWEEELPDSVLNLIKSEQFKGGSILSLSKRGSRAGTQRKTKDCENNFAFVKPAVKAKPRTVPSAYFLADGLIRLNIRLNGKLLKVKVDGQSIKVLALQIGKQLKELISHLRQLFRNTLNSHSSLIAELKALMARKEKSNNSNGSSSDADQVDSDSTHACKKSDGESAGEESGSESDDKKSDDESLGGKKSCKSDGDKSSAMSADKKSNSESDGDKSDAQSSDKKSGGESDGDEASDAESAHKKRNGENDAEKSHVKSADKKGKAESDDEKSDAESADKKSDGGSDDETSNAESAEKKSDGGDGDEKSDAESADKNNIAETVAGENSDATSAHGDADDENSDAENASKKTKSERGDKKSPDLFLDSLSSGSPSKYTWGDGREETVRARRLREKMEERQAWKSEMSKEDLEKRRVRLTQAWLTGDPEWWGSEGKPASGESDSSSEKPDNSNESEDSDESEDNKSPAAGRSPLNHENLRLKELEELWVAAGLPRASFNAKAAVALLAEEDEAKTPEVRSELAAPSTQAYPEDMQSNGKASHVDELGSASVSFAARELFGDEDPKKARAMKKALATVRSIEKGEEPSEPPKVPASFSSVAEELTARPPPLVAHARKARAKKTEESKSEEGKSGSDKSSDMGSTSSEEDKPSKKPKKDGNKQEQKKSKRSQGVDKRKSQQKKEDRSDSTTDKPVKKRGRPPKVPEAVANAAPAEKAAGKKESVSAKGGKKGKPWTKRMWHLM
jgi:hypothetical protein